MISCKKMKKHSIDEISQKSEEYLFLDQKDTAKNVLNEISDQEFEFTEFLNIESDETSNLDSDVCSNEKSAKFLAYKSKDTFDQEPEQLSDELDNSPTYLEYEDPCSSQDSTTLQTSDKECEMSRSDTKIYTRFTCEICKLKFDNKSETSKHLSSHKYSRECEICNIIMAKDAYRNHMKWHKESYEKRIAKNRIQCEICGKVIVKSYLKFHMLKHGSYDDKLSRLKQCPECNKSVNYYYFNSHMKRMHLNLDSNNTSEENDEICPVCNKAVKESKIKVHIASHSTSKSKSYICEQCGKVLKNYSAFQTHLLMHNGSLSYKCELCPYRGLHLGLLRIHIRTHTKDYQYECSVCKKKFITKSNLSQHERTHSPPEFSCSKCGKKFSLKSRLDLHINTIHLNIRDEKCDLCGKAFGTKYALKAHEKKVHKILSQQSLYRGRPASYMKAEQTAENI